MITNTQLEYLVAVDRQGSFSRAAEGCFVTQPTLSMQIQKLEAELGVSLFDRGKKPVQPTPIGRQVIDQAYRALRAFKGIGEVVREQQETVAGELRLGIIPTLGPYLLPRFVPGFLSDLSGVRVIVRELVTDDIVAALRRDSLDAGIAASPLGMPDIREQPLFYEPFSGFVAPGHRLAQRTRLGAADLVAEEMVLLDSGHCLHADMHRICTGRPSPDGGNVARLRFVGGSLEGVVRIVASGHGVTLLPELAVLELPDAWRRLLRPLREPVPARIVSLLTHGQGVKTRLLERLRQAILNGIPAALKKRQAGWQLMATRPDQATTGHRRASSSRRKGSGIR